MIRQNYKEPYGNYGGYADPTAYHAMKNTSRRPDSEEYKRFRKCFDVIIYILDAAGFDLEGKIVVRNRQTGVYMSRHCVHDSDQF